MEPKQYIMLGVLLFSGILGSTILVYVLSTLDAETGEDDAHEAEHH
ncbi:hypothetical protein BH09SUM1_BH09SUM1_03060 [soil metagenome]